jgi:hypothetical protein
MDTKCVARLSRTQTRFVGAGLVPALSQGTHEGCPYYSCSPKSWPKSTALSENHHRAGPGRWTLSPQSFEITGLWGLAGDLP